jgi:hypothetical protein
MTDKPVISDDEVTFAMRFVMMRTTHPGQRECMKAALSAFLLARVPPYESLEYKWSDADMANAQGFNACREQVLQGREDKT